MLGSFLFSHWELRSDWCVAEAKNRCYLLHNRQCKCHLRFETIFRLHFEEGSTRVQRERRENEPAPILRRQRVQLYRRPRRPAQTRQSSAHLLRTGIFV